MNARALALALAGSLLLAQGVLPSDTPAAFQVATDSFDHQRREVEIPMRDGVTLHTVILVPRGARKAGLLLTRTPYDANAMTRKGASSNLGMAISGYDRSGTLPSFDHPVDVILAGGYIRVVQDVRGKHGSKGDYVMNRPLRGPLNPTAVDHATDTYDTIDWLVKHVPEGNGRVGILGISYDGFTTLMALVDPHPALKVAVPMNPMVDGWRGDDWFHNGAFRQANLSYINDQEATRGSTEPWWSGHNDDYEAFLEAGSAGAMGRAHGTEQLGFWRQILAHPAYDAFWQAQAMDRVLAARPLKVPTLLVHGLFDQEDNYGALAVYRALKPKDLNGDKLFLAIGPWYHGQQIGDGSRLGALNFHADTSRQFRREVLGPFLAEHLQEGGPKAGLAAVTAFETGSDQWRRLPAWPGPARATRLYLLPGLKAGFTPGPDPAAFEEYLSDPAKPVPYRARPIHAVSYQKPALWAEWLADDQREASGRTDVLAYVSEPLTAPRRLAGEAMVNLLASTSGTDADWVVKLIDVYPAEMPGQTELGGYQLMVAGEIFRGRYRESLEQAKPLEPGKVLRYTFALPGSHHVFLPGHRIMVQVQSSWFPLYDRNPQTFVPSIFWAEPGAYRKATQRIHAGSYLELPLSD
jgi:putative CocE/NonD family hydrolase